MLITTLQILQMAGGIYILSRARSEHLAGNYCEVPKSVIDSGFLMYSSYLALFVQFFLRAYVFGERKNLGIKLKSLDDDFKKPAPYATDLSSVNNNLLMKSG
jgi:hypothetical protein